MYFLMIDGHEHVVTSFSLFVHDLKMMKIATFAESDHFSSVPYFDFIDFFRADVAKQEIVIMDRFIREKDGFIVEVLSYSNLIVGKSCEKIVTFRQVDVQDAPIYSRTEHDFYSRFNALPQKPKTSNFSDYGKKGGFNDIFNDIFK